MSADPPPIVLGIGELLWDDFPQGRRAGGAPANVAFHATQLGNRGVICSRVGADRAGRELLHELQSHGVSTDHVQVDESLPTGRVTVDTTDPAHPAYVIHRDVAWDAIDFDQNLEQIVQDAAALCVGTLAQRSPRSRAAIGGCLDAAAGALRVYDVNLRPDGYRREWIAKTLAKAQIVKLNLDEVGELAAMLGTSSDPREFSRFLIGEYGVELVCVTRAAEGSILFTTDETVDIEGHTTPLADAVGAGDAFTAAMITARLRGWSLERTGNLANRVGALVVSRHGAMPDLEREYGNLLREQPSDGR